MEAEWHGTAESGKVHAKCDGHCNSVANISTHDCVYDKYIWNGYDGHEIEWLLEVVKCKVITYAFCKLMK